MISFRRTRTLIVSTTCIGMALSSCAPATGRPSPTRPAQPPVEVGLASNTTPETSPMAVDAGSTSVASQATPMMCDGSRCDERSPFCCLRADGQDKVDATCVPTREHCQGAYFECHHGLECRKGEQCCRDADESRHCRSSCKQREAIACLEASDCPKPSSPHEIPECLIEMHSVAPEDGFCITEELPIDELLKLLPPDGNADGILNSK